METVTVWITQYGYLGLFSLLMLGIIGLPVPDETLLTFSGYLVYKQEFSFGWTITAAFFGSITGITVSYLLGRSIGLFLLRRYGKYVLITPEKLDMVHQWFERRGKWTLTIGYFIPGVRHLTAYTAGATKLELHEFMAFAYSGGLIWSLSFILLGYFIGEKWETVVDQFQNNVLIGTCVLVVVIAIVLLIKKRFLRVS